MVDQAGNTWPTCCLVVIAELIFLCFSQLLTKVQELEAC